MITPAKASGRAKDLNRGSVFSDPSTGCRRVQPARAGFSCDVTALPDLAQARARAGPAPCKPPAGADARLSRTWIAMLRGRVRAALAATSGVQDADDVAALDARASSDQTFDQWFDDRASSSTTSTCVRIRLRQSSWDATVGSPAAQALRCRR